jgi:uncharacterized protein YbcI
VHRAASVEPALAARYLRPCVAVTWVSSAEMGNNRAMADDLLSGEVLAAITREMVRIKADSYGKGATEAKSYQCDNFLFCVLKGGMTQVERTLLRHDDPDLVRQVRLRFQALEGHSFKEAVERISGRKVLTYESQVLFDPDYSVEIFVLGSGA